MSVTNLEGNITEIGVYKGYTSKLIHTFTQNKLHYCYDTFCGIMGTTTEDDKHKNGEFSCSLENVKNTINMINVNYKVGYFVININYKVGYFPDTFQENDEKFCFVHSDKYIGTYNTIKFLKDLIIPGGKIIFDDYCWGAYPGVEKALNEFKNIDTGFIH